MLQYPVRIVLVTLILLGAVAAAAFAEHAQGRLLVKLSLEASAAASLPDFGERKFELGLPALDATLARLGVAGVERLLPPAPPFGRAPASQLGLDRWCVVQLPETIDLHLARQALIETGDVEEA